MKKMSVVLFFWMALFSQSFADDAVKVDVLLNTAQSWDGQVLPAYPKGTPEIKILKIIVAPKTKLPMHEHPVINAAILTKGTLRVTTKEGKILVLKPNDAIAEVVNTWHYGENIGDDEVEIIVFYAGVKGTPITIKK